MVTPHERAVEAFEGEELAPIYDNTRREHSTRSTYQRIWVSNNSLTDKDLVMAGPGSGIDRVKRLTLELVLPKFSSPLRGWVGFQRISEATQVASGPATAAMFSDAEILRPIPFCTNIDHAIYLRMYLPAVNLVDDGNLRLRLFKTQSATVTIPWVGRYVIERSV